MEGRTDEPKMGRNRNSLPGALNNLRAVQATGAAAAQSASELPEVAFFRIRFNTSGKPPFFMMRLKLDR